MRGNAVPTMTKPGLGRCDRCPRKKVRYARRYAFVVPGFTLRLTCLDTSIDSQQIYLCGKSELF